MEGTGKTVLVVDDEVIVLSVAQSMLPRHGYSVLVAQNGDEALRLFEMWPDIAVDVALLDINLPLMDGFELAERLRQLRPTLAVIFISGYSDDPELRPLATRDVPLISKPFTSLKLVVAIERGLAHIKAALAHEK